MCLKIGGPIPMFDGHIPRFSVAIAGYPAISINPYCCDRCTS